MSVDPIIAERYAELAHAHAEFNHGRAAAFQALYAHTDDVSIFGGFGGHEQGWDTVGPRLDWACSQFEPYDGEWSPTPIAGGFGTDFGYLVWVDHSEVTTLSGSPRMQQLRVTHVYRRDSEGWKIVHRHADPLVQKDIPT